MAKMVPLELKDGDYLSEGEKEAFEILKNGLSDEWTVIYSLRWVTDDDIVLAKSCGESDFVLIHQDYGVLILEVKGGVISCINGEWSSITSSNTKVSIKDPEKQASEAKFNLISRFKRSKIYPYVTTALWFPDCIKEKSTLPLNMPKEVILDMTSSSNIEKSIIDIFKYRIDKEGFGVNRLIDSDYKKVMDILNPKIEIKIPLLRLTNKLKIKFNKLNEEQNEVFQQLDGNKFIAVKGHAGTGKTVLAVKKAFRESEQNKKVILLCYNNLLSEQIKEESEDAFEVLTIHSFAEEYLKSFNHDSYNKFIETGDFDEMMEDFVKEAKNNKTKHKKFYDSILIDEGQDFTEEWFNAVNELLEEDGNLCVFYDENQMLYNKFGRNDISFLNKGTKYNLMRNMRNTDDICTSSLKVINENINSVKLNGVQGITPDIIFSDDTFDTTTQLRSVIRALKKDEYLSDKNITVLTIEARKKMKFQKSIANEFSGVVESIRKFKGLESDVVIIPDVGTNFLEETDKRNLLYVGISRAKAHVILIVDIHKLNRKQKVDFKKSIREKIVATKM